MCEVKTCEPVKKSKKLLQFTIFDGVKDRTVVSGIATVSYTHLDVYKRQVPDNHRRLSKCLLFALFGVLLFHFNGYNRSSDSARICLFHCLLSVSYTHLDVYKRQLILFFTANSFAHLSIPFAHPELSLIHI